jgi:hypothetical protein
VSPEAAVLAAIYVVAYLSVQAWRRRSPGRVTVLCPLRGAEVPAEIVERLGAPSAVHELAPLLRAEFTLAYVTEAPGIALASITDESSLESGIGRFLHPAIFVPGRSRWLALLAARRWSANLLFGLALEVLHRLRPRTLLVDFRPPPRERARELGISTPESDLDLGMYAYEIRCRLRRYSRYREAAFDLVFCGEGGMAWRVGG